MASTGLLYPAALGFRVRRRGQPTVSLSICRFAVLGGFPHQLTLSQSSRSGPWCGRQTSERPDPRVSACYLRTRELYPHLLSFMQTPSCIVWRSSAWRRHILLHTSTENTPVDVEFSQVLPQSVQERPVASLLSEPTCRGRSLTRTERSLTRTVQLHSDCAVRWATEEFRQGKDSFLLSKVSRPVLGDTQAPVVTGIRNWFRRK